MATNTKLLIAQAYADLLTKKNVDKVTVKDVVEVCGITRQTFYYHYHDLLDVIEWSIRRQTEMALRESLQQNNWEEALCSFLTVACKNRPLVRKLYASQKRFETNSLIIDSVRTWLTRVYQEKCENADLSLQQTEFAIQFYTYAICGVLLETVMSDDTDMRSKAEQIVQLMKTPLT